MNRPQLEAEYREYFSEIRKFEPFPMTVSYENVLDFLEWHDRQYESLINAQHAFTSGDAPCGRLKCQ